MITLLSPSKTLDFESTSPCDNYSESSFINKSTDLINILDKLTISDIRDLMGVSDKIAELNYNRFKSWENPNLSNLSKQALYAFKGDVYSGLDAYTINNSKIDFVQNNLRILSGLYGVLKPLDKIMPYRLEMGTKLTTEKGKNLYQYWGNSITNFLNNDMEEKNHSHIINLASNEYFKSVNQTHLNHSIITPSFKENKNGQYKIIAIYAKKARGLMARYIIDNTIKECDELKKFNNDGYEYNDKLSTRLNYVFTR